MCDVFIIKCYVTNYPQTQQLQPTSGYSLIVSVGQELGAAQLGDSGLGALMRVQLRCWPGLPHLKA